MGPYTGAENWLYRAITTNSPLQEKTALMWHSIFATGYPGKVVHGKVLWDQIKMFRRYGMGSYKTLLIELSKDPAMIAWLDNLDNHNGAINENYGRELLELFSMGVSNYFEDDIKECSRAFTGLTIGNTEYMTVRSQRDSDWPYGRISWHFEYRPEDHDDGEKTFLDQTGRFNGEDIIDIICRQPATAQFISRHLYHFFVADEPPVPQWPYTPPRDPEAIEVLSKTYFQSQYDIVEMLRVLFNSDFFRSESCRYEKVKSPMELVAGVLRLSGEFDRPRREILNRGFSMRYMGQHLTNAPSVEGWHQGDEWIDTGNLVERLNFASQQLGDMTRPGVKAMVDNLLEADGGSQSPESLVDSCLDQLGVIDLSDESRSTLINYASEAEKPSDRHEHRQMVSHMLQLIATTHEFQRC